MEMGFASFATWFAARRAELSRGGLWLAGDEPGRPDPAGFESARLRILICRLSSYDDVEASITHRLLLAVAQAIPGVYADLAFFPSPADAARMKKDGVPLWLATGCKRAPGDFDVVAVSLSVQQEAANLPAALRDSGLTLDFEGRLAAARHPLVILGGHGAASAPFLHGDAAGPGSGGLVDAVCLGDGVAWLRDFLRRLDAHKAADAPKMDFLQTLAREVPGTYVPAFYRHGMRDGRLGAIEPRFPDLPLPVEFRQDPLETWLADYDGAYIPFAAEEAEETLPLSAGCAYRCRFCQTGWMRREFSAAARTDLKRAARRFKAAMANADLNLLASDACSVPGLEAIVDDLAPLFRRVSVKSLSVSSLVRKPESIRLLRKLAKHEFTFGVEGVGARLRAYLGKPATAADLVRIAGSLAAGGLRQLKLFFIATGLEEERDFAELDALLKSLRAAVPACRIIASFMPLFHAPFTPLQFAAVRAISPETAEALAARVRQAGAEFRWSAYPDEIALMNRLCRAGRAATPAWVDFALRRGLRYDQRLDSGLIRELAHAVPADDAEKSGDAVFPWSDLQAANSAALWRSYEKARQDFQSSAEKPRAAGPAPRLATPPAEAAPEAPERLFFWAEAAPGQAGQPDHVVARSFFRRLFAGWKAGSAAYLGEPRLLRPPGVSGLVQVSAEFRPGARPPAKNAALKKAAPPAIPDGDLLFGIRWPGPAAARAFERQLKADRIKFQTVRRGASRWHVVERAYRARCGVAAVREEETQTVLYSSQRPTFRGTDLAALAGPDGATFAIWAPVEAPCPKCGGPRHVALKSLGKTESPICFDCGSGFA